MKMPPRKEPSSLQDMCIQKFAQLVVAVVSHAEALKSSVKKTELNNIAGASLVTAHDIFSPVAGRLKGKIVPAAIDVLVNKYGSDNYQQYNYVEFGRILEVLFHPSLMNLDLSGLVKLGVISDHMFDEGEKVLTRCLPNMNHLTSLILQTHGGKITLPVCDDMLLDLIGQHCPKLQFLDLSYNNRVTGEGLSYLIPKPNVRPGCSELKRIYLYECSVTARDVVSLLANLHDLTFVGFKETGKAVKKLLRKEDQKTVPQLQLKLTHVDNLGSKANVLVPSSLRCKKHLAETIAVLCPAVQHLKLRVTDEDVANLDCFKEVKTIELLYNTGPLHSPAQGTEQFLQSIGCKLQSIAIICHVLNTSVLYSIGKYCPFLNQFWCRCNFLNNNMELKPTEGHFSHLKTLYFRIGETEQSLGNLPHWVLPYLLANCMGLQELILAVRSDTINDKYMQQILISRKFIDLEKVLIVVPSLNQNLGAICLTLETANMFLNECPNLHTLGNLISWQVSLWEVQTLQYSLEKENYNINIMYKKMIIR